MKTDIREFNGEEEIKEAVERVKEEILENGWDSYLYSKYVVSSSSVEGCMMELLTRKAVYGPSSVSFPSPVDTLTSVGVPVSILGIVKDPHPTVTELFAADVSPEIRGELAGLVLTEEDHSKVESKAQKIKKREKIHTEPVVRMFHISLTPVNV